MGGDQAKLVWKNIKTCQISGDFQIHVLHKLLWVIGKHKLAVLYTCMQTLTDEYGTDKLTAWGIIFENKLLLTARRWKLYPITLWEPCRSNMTNIRAYSPTYTPGCNHGTTSLQEEIALQPTSPSAILSSCPLWVFLLLPSSMCISALTRFQLYDTESPHENTWHTWSDPPFGGMLFFAFSLVYK